MKYEKLRMPIAPEPFANDKINIVEVIECVWNKKYNKGYRVVRNKVH